MVITRCVTSDVHIRSGALIPLFLGGLGWPDTQERNPLFVARLTPPRCTSYTELAFLGSKCGTGNSFKPGQFKQTEETLASAYYI